MIVDCNVARRHLGAVRDREDDPDPVVDEHVIECTGCSSWLADVDAVTRALCLRTVDQPTFVDAALEMWDGRAGVLDHHRATLGRFLLGLAAAGCLVVGLLIAGDGGGHTHIGVTAQREVIILEVALALGLACAAARPRVYLAGIVPILGIVAVVNLVVSVINMASGNSTLLAEVAHLPFVLGLVGALLVHRSDPVSVDLPGTSSPVVHA